MESFADEFRKPGSSGRASGRIRRAEAGLEFARVLNFSDGVFAIAITLLVLALEIPENSSDFSGQLSDQGPDLFAFALSFAVLGRIWWIFHHRLFSELAEFDGPLIALNFVYLALVALVPFSSELLGDYSGEATAVAIYAANIGGLGLIGGLMVEYAFGRELMSIDAQKRRDEYVGFRNFAFPGVFLASIAIAFAVGPEAAMLSWLSLVALGPIADRLRRRDRG